MTEESRWVGDPYVTGISDQYHTNTDGLVAADGGLLDSKEPTTPPDTKPAPTCSCGPSEACSDCVPKTIIMKGTP